MRRLLLAVIGTVVLAAAVVGVLRLLGATEHNLVAGAAGVVVASLVWLPATRRWSARAHVCWASTVFLFVVYLIYAIEWTFHSNLGPVSTVGGVLLWLLEVFAALLSCAYLWELCDALGTEHWRRRITRSTRLAGSDDELPMVSLHVPAHNEPPDMVMETLRSLLRLDYPRYEIIVIDDNTDDEDLWRPVEAWCQRHRVKFVHLADWPGYKSGALNYALRRMTSPDAEVIGIVDSDYQVEPGWLRRCAPAFADPWIGFVQSPQDYRDWRQAHYYRRLYYSYNYFFAVSQPSRNEHDGAIIAGTMGLIRRVALDELGGWDEWCITEDAELSLRLLRAGWHGLHVDETFGRGIMPLTFEALKGQRYRWCFGGIQILRMHWRSMIPGRPGRANHLTVSQRWAYLAGALQWYGDLLGLLFLIFLLAGAANLATGGGQLFPHADHLPGRGRTGHGPAGPGAGGGPAAPGHRRVVAGRDRRVLHLAVHLAGGRPRLGARAVRQEGRVPAHAEDQRADQVVGGAAGQLGRIDAGAVRLRRHRGRLVQVRPAQRPAAGRTAAVPHARHGRGPGQQLGRPPGGAARRAA